MSDSQKIKPQRFALQFDPPTLVMQYQRVGESKSRARKMPVRGIRPGSDPAQVTDALIKRHEAYLGKGIVPRKQVQRLVAKLVERKGDLQQVPEEELKRIKDEMEKDFEKNALKPGDEGYVHDVRKDFGEAESDCEWDDDIAEPSDDDDDFW
eukprot:TRINITY_DN2272_c0_g1_i16.p1 TRINITY_DN2272_c0_g1~~TRINITY_DN2272_c0_g1_i16.p1  ORF type:complete len:152 (-),score=36.68 TRINITY_DN2272_c0_g1_i16:43-498(-)